jgi:hypothetical protein
VCYIFRVNDFTVCEAAVWNAGRIEYGGGGLIGARGYKCNGRRLWNSYVVVLRIARSMRPICLDGVQEL